MSDRRQKLAAHVAILCDSCACASAKIEAWHAISAIELALQESEASEAALQGRLAEADTTIGRLSIDAQFNRATIAGWKSMAETARQANRELRADNAELADSYNSELAYARDRKRQEEAANMRYASLCADYAKLETELAMSQATICALVTKG